MIDAIQPRSLGRHLHTPSRPEGHVCPPRTTGLPRFPTEATGRHSPPSISASPPVSISPTSPHPPPRPFTDVSAKIPRPPPSVAPPAGHQRQPDLESDVAEQLPKYEAAPPEYNTIYQDDGPPPPGFHEMEEVAGSSSAAPQSTGDVVVDVRPAPQRTSTPAPGYEQFDPSQSAPSPAPVSQSQSQLPPPVTASYAQPAQGRFVSRAWTRLTGGLNR